MYQILLITFKKQRNHGSGLPQAIFLLLNTALRIILHITVVQLACAGWPLAEVRHEHPGGRPRRAQYDINIKDSPTLTLTVREAADSNRYA